MNNYGAMEEEKKSGSSLADKLKSFTSKASKPGSKDPKFESFHTDQDLEGQTISMRDGDNGPKSMGQKPISTAASS